MTIGLANASSKARNLTVITNSNQGGGSKKCGLPFQVGRTSWDSIYFNNTNTRMGHCQTLGQVQRTLVFANISRPIGSMSTGVSYWHVSGL